LLRKYLSLILQQAQYLISRYVIRCKPRESNGIISGLTVTTVRLWPLVTHSK
jgi:hypothetical protein